MDLDFIETSDPAVDKPITLNVCGGPTLVKFTITNSFGRQTMFLMNLSDFRQLLDSGSKFAQIFEPGSEDRFKSFTDRLLGEEIDRITQEDRDAEAERYEHLFPYTDSND